MGHLLWKRWRHLVDHSMVGWAVATSDEAVNLQKLRMNRLRKLHIASAQASRISVAASLGSDHWVPSCCRILGTGLPHDLEEFLEYWDEVSRSAAA